MRYFFLISFLIFYTSENVCYGLRKFYRGKYFDTENAEEIGLGEVKSLWFEQILDHFDLTNNQTWKQRYFVNDEFYKPGSPIFLMIGGEGEITESSMKGAWTIYAKDHNALCLQLEHRFYGKSHPTADLSTGNLKYLSSEQALADLAFFVRAINKEYKNDVEVKWIAFGGSYPGSLAAWFRQKYPNIVHGAISSSGPLLAKIDFVEYYDVVTESIRTYSDECVNVIRKGYDQIDILLKHRIGQQNIDKNFRLCTPIDKSISNTLDMANFYENVASSFAGVVQYNKDNSPHAKITIDDVCNILLNKTIGAPVQRLAQVNSLMLDTNKEECMDYVYSKMISDMKKSSWEDEAGKGGMRQWTYQTCAEFGFYQTSTNPDALFRDKFPVNFFVRQCSDVYGAEFSGDFLTKHVDMTNGIYGALHPFTTNVLYVHGSIDPWHALGLIKSDDPDLPTIYINGTAHCANMYLPRDSDPQALVDARIKIREYIKNLLNTKI